MLSQLELWIVFGIVALLCIALFVMVQRFWQEKLHMSEEDEAFERRMASLNQHQANQRRDDDIVRVLRGDSQRTVDQRDDS